ncbi:hypothetical protein SORBI_3007G196000 [Sorghum bicolor]|uniref:Uncharacterized protein n=2 Tax=Sorghum bicolor TaxID=4558 RepID=A0A1Z5RBI7_SORBI|nr:hypothetical protein SORBI_3007G196000 [Sorghum bicolor]OQU80841.1 hypothetical protein SORBI_3007G196000 [Sorghum bicolor]
MHSRPGPSWQASWGPPPLSVRPTTFSTNALNPAAHRLPNKTPTVPAKTNQRQIFCSSAALPLQTPSPSRRRRRRVDPELRCRRLPASAMGKTPPKKEAEGSPRNKARRVDDAAPTTGSVASAPSPTGKTPPKAEEAEGSPRKKAPRLDDAALATAPGASERKPTGKSPPKGVAEGSPPKRSRSPRNKSPRRQDKWPAAALPLLTVPESSELIVEAAGRASDEKRCKCNHVITDSAIEKLIASLRSKDAWTCYGCWHEFKKGIIRIRPEKSDLLICVTCYDHLCCGVGSIAYPFGHSRAHALKKKHWFAVLYCDPERGYCFKCNTEVPMPVKFGDGDEVGLQEIRNIVSRKLLAAPPSVGQTEAVNPKKVEMTGKVQAESHPSGFGVDLADKWPSYGSRSSDSQGYAIRGIPNRGNTCYMSAVLQCLFVLGKLRERMLALDRPKSRLVKVLKELFLEASAAGDLLNPNEVLECVSKDCAPRFRVGAMEDSHELLMALRDLWNQGEVNDNWQSHAPTAMDSIFRFKMLQTLSCKKCGYSSPTSVDLWDLKLDFPSKWHPTKSAASQQTSESPRSRKREIAGQLFPADVQRNLEKMQIVSGYSHVIGSEVTLEETQKPLEVGEFMIAPVLIKMP